MSIEDTAKLTSERTIRTIPALQVLKNNSIRQVREAAYARVSTKSEEQLSSYILQKKYYEEYIKSKNNTIYAGLYCDEESGKSISGRKGFKELLNDCREGKIDRIITKTVSRFARNMVECMQTARELKNRGITIYFESQSLDTKDESSFVILSILAALAEEEIRTISNNVKWGIHKRYKEGKVHMSGRMCGYEIKGGRFRIIPEEVDTVKMIFNDYLAGMTIRQIAKKLEQQGIPSPRGHNKWQHTTIKNMLQNEKYIGDALLQKTFKVDVLSPRQINHGQKDKYEIKNNHPAIIDRETFEAVQAELNRREYEKISLNNERTRYSSQYPLSAKIECGECGTKFRRHCQQHGLNKVDIWVCVKHQKESDICHMKPIKEKVVEGAFVQVLNELVTDKQKIITNLERSVRAIILNNPIKDIKQLERELITIERKMIEISTRCPLNAQDQMEIQELQQNAITLREEMTIAERLRGSHDILKQRVKEIEQVIKLPYIEYRGELFRSLVEKVIVNGKKDLKFIFKCGLEINTTVA